MPLTQLPPLDTMVLNLRSSEIEAVLAEMFAQVAGCEAIIDQDRAWKDLLTRHAAGPVALSADIGLPHARTSAVRRVIFAAARHPTGVAFDPQHPAVRLIFMVLTPKEQPAEYLQLVAALTAKLRDSAVRARLLVAQNQDEFEAALSH